MITFKNSKIVGISGCVPKNKVNNSLSDKEKGYVGVSSKYYDQDGKIQTSDLCLNAAKDLIRKFP